MKKIMLSLEEIQQNQMDLILGVKSDKIPENTNFKY